MSPRTRFLLLLISLPVSPLLIHAQIPNSGLVAEWLFSGNSSDGSGNGHHGTVYGATLVDDRFGSANRAYFFDGVNDYISVPHHSGFNFGVEFSISVWFRVCDRNGQAFLQMVMLGKPATSTTAPEQGYGLLAEFGVDGQTTGTRIVFRDYTPLLGYLVANGFYSTTTWHHVVVAGRQNGATSRLYIDGQQVNIDNGAWAWTDNVENLVIGGLPTSNFYQGQLDDIRVYDRQLTATEVTALYREGGWTGAGAGGPDMQLDFTAVDDTVICAGQSVQLSLLTDADRISWNTKNGLREEFTPSPIATPTTTTTYTVTGVKYGEGLCPDSTITSKSITVEVVEAPTANAGGPFYRCVGDTITLGQLTLGGKPPYRWEWTPGTDLDNLQKEQPKFIPREPGTFRFLVTVTDALGCSSTDEATVTVTSRPTFSLNTGDTAIYCLGSEGLELNATVEGNPAFFDFRWTDAAGDTIADSSHVTVAPSEPTRYFISVVDEFGLCPSIDSVWVIPVAAPTVDPGEDRTICPGDSIRLGPADVNPSWAYEWSPESGLAERTAPQITVLPTATTTYRLRVTDTLTGCRGESEVTLRVLDVEVDVEESVVDAGTLDGCRSDVELMLHLVNNGADTGIVAGVAGDVPGITLLDRGLPLPPGEKTEVRIRFTPPGAGTWTGTLAFLIGPCGDTLRIPFTAVKEEALIGLNPVALDFGQVPECEIEEIDTTVAVTNNGTADARLLPATLPTGYTITTPALPVDLPAGDTVEITLRYTPTGPGVYGGTFELPYESGTCEDILRVELQGIVEEVEVTSGYPTLDVGIIDGCEDGRDTTLVLRNGSNLPVTVSQADLPTGFSLIDPIPTTIDPNDSVRLRLRFAPGATGIVSGMARFSYEPCGPEVTVEFTGEKRGVSVSLPDTLDFGSVPICGDPFGELEFGITLSTGGADEGQISLVTLSLPFGTDIPNGAALQDGTEHKFLAWFAPTVEGTFQEEMILKIEPCGLTRRIVLRGRATVPLLTSRPFDFGTQPVGMAQNGDVLFINEGSDSLTVGDLDGLTSPFTLLGSVPPLPARLAPGDTLRATVEYVPSPGLSTSPIRATLSEPCELATTADVRGEGNPTARARIITESMTAAPGVETDLVLSLRNGEGLDVAGATEFVAEVEFEPSVLVVNDATPWRLENGMRIVEIRGQRGAGEELARVSLGATLGRVEQTELRLHSFEWIDPVAPISIDTVHGTFQLEELCREGGVRLFDPEGVIAIRGVAPNPVTGEMTIRYSLSEHGEHAMRLLDVNGREVLSLFSGPFVPGVYELQVRVDDLAAGRYWLTLQTPTLAVTEIVEVVK